MLALLGLFFKGGTSDPFSAIVEAVGADVALVTFQTKSPNICFIASPFARWLLGYI